MCEIYPCPFFDCLILTHLRQPALRVFARFITNTCLPPHNQEPQDVASSLRWVTRWRIPLHLDYRITDGGTNPQQIFQTLQVWRP